MSHPCDRWRGLGAPRCEAFTLDSLGSEVVTDPEMAFR